MLTVDKEDPFLSIQFSTQYTHSLIYKSINLPTTTTYLLSYTVQRLFTYLLIYLQPLRIYCHLLYSVHHSFCNASDASNFKMWARHLGQIKHMYS